MWMLLYNFYCLTGLFSSFCMYVQGGVGVFFLFCTKTEKPCRTTYVATAPHFFLCLLKKKLLKNEKEQLMVFSGNLEVGFPGPSMLSETLPRFEMSDWKSEVFWEPRVCNSIQLLCVSALSESCALHGLLPTVCPLFVLLHWLFCAMSTCTHVVMLVSRAHHNTFCYYMLVFANQQQWISDL